MPDTPKPFRVPAPLAAGLGWWVRRLAPADLPIMASTASALEGLRAIEDEVDARMLTEVIGVDPLMTLKLLIHTTQLQRGRRLGEAETVREALVMTGITPFFRDFGPQPTVEQHLADLPEALDGLQRVLHRACRASRFALGFAVHRMDQDAPVIHEAALLHDFAEMLLWLHAPVLALQMQQRQQADPTLRSAAIQRELLGCTLPEVQHALMVQWRLPPLLVQISDDRHAEASQVRNVLLAVRLARHSAASWDNPALPDDVRDIARLLNLGENPTLALLQDLDEDMAPDLPPAPSPAALGGPPSAGAAAG
ncbi:HDOD domain-containing protein [Ideonella livida]|uniref:HDOD domain-containing protein n=1 Tax=Ideonella livida TaxID=2707176 RepID=A0A7C9PIJ0_9BURK|nr:HDOD domain-containing protein [Ideonella livida]NDY92688.1 HDOD domain-containing protein [Ideonella livida]